jgi:hypothetical protein
MSTLDLIALIGSSLCGAGSAVVGASIIREKRKNSGEDSLLTFILSGEFLSRTQRNKRARAH